MTVSTIVDLVQSLAWSLAVLVIVYIPRELISRAFNDIQVRLKP